MLDRFDAGPGVLPVVDDGQQLLGIVSLDEAFIASNSPELRPLLLAADLMRTQVVPLTPDDSLDRALELFVENDLRALPIVDTRSAPRAAGDDQPHGSGQRLPAARPCAGRDSSPNRRANECGPLSSPR